MTDKEAEGRVETRGGSPESTGRNPGGHGVGAAIVTVKELHPRQEPDASWTGRGMGVAFLHQRTGSMVELV